MIDFSKFSDRQLRLLLEANIDRFPASKHFSKSMRETVVAERTRDELIGLLSEGYELFKNDFNFVIKYHIQIPNDISAHLSDEQFDNLMSIVDTLLIHDKKLEVIYSKLH